MQYGICHLSVVAIKQEADNAGEMVTQILYGEHFKVLEQRKHWSKIRNAYDGCEGWVLNTQFTSISQEDYERIEKHHKHKFSADLVSFVSTKNQLLIPVVLGSCIDRSQVLDHKHEGQQTKGTISKATILDTALLYLNAPYLHGGKTPFGIDASGLAQMVYRIHGYKLERSSEKQAKQGEALSFIEESEPGDLAFFDNKEGVIDHVGIIMKDNYIIHSYGKVRIDRLDHTGIFNDDLRNYSHPLRVIKKMT